MFLPRVKKHAERTLRNILVCCKLRLLLSKVLLVYGIRNPSQISCQHVILHNMIIEHERNLDLEFFFNNVGSRVKPSRNPLPDTGFVRCTSSLKTMLRIPSSVMIWVSLDAATSIAPSYPPTSQSPATVPHLYQPSIGAIQPERGHHAGFAAVAIRGEERSTRPPRRLGGLTGAAR
jgi:hypothetical protein